VVSVLDQTCASIVHLDLKETIVKTLIVSDSFQIKPLRSVLEEDNVQELILALLALDMVEINVNLLFVTQNCQLIQLFVVEQLDQLVVLLQTIAHAELDTKETNVRIKFVTECHLTNQTYVLVMVHALPQELVLAQQDMVDQTVNMQFVVVFLEAIQLFVLLVDHAQLLEFVLALEHSLERLVSFFNVRVEIFQVLMFVQLETMIFTISSSSSL